MASDLPVLWVQQTGIARIERTGFKLDSTGTTTAQLSSRPRAKFAEYIPAHRCRDCRFFVSGIPAMCEHWQGCVMPDGSGFCYEWREKV